MKGIIKITAWYGHALQFAQVNPSFGNLCQHFCQATLGMVGEKIDRSFVGIGNTTSHFFFLQHQKPGIIIFLRMDIGRNNLEAV